MSSGRITVVQVVSPCETSPDFVLIRCAAPNTKDQGQAWNGGETRGRGGGRAASENSGRQSATQGMESR
ncbi:unnamed protein product [Arctogadus glacialis]